MAVKTLSVNLKNESYNILIGEQMLENIGAIISPVLKRKKIVIVTDKNVMAAQGERLINGLNNAEIVHKIIILPPGEKSKSFDNVEFLVSRFLDEDVEREDVVAAFGGGVIGDIVGFVASITRRGCRYAQIPTTLLSQADSAVGGKTAINVAQGKNLVGAFHQPCLVVSDIGCLKTLPQREMRAGYAEVLKYGLIQDYSFYEWLERCGANILSLDDTSLCINAIHKACENKAEIISLDEKENGIRSLLNFGHTFGHAIEKVYAFDNQVIHGEAVSVGMALAFDFSATHGYCTGKVASRVKKHLAEINLPYSLQGLPHSDNLTSENLFLHMTQDKKIQNGKITLILARKIGKAFIKKNVSESEIKTFLIQKLRTED